MTVNLFAKASNIWGPDHKGANIQEKFAEIGKQKRCLFKRNVKNNEEPKDAKDW